MASFVVIYPYAGPLATDNMLKENGEPALISPLYIYWHLLKPCKTLEIPGCNRRSDIKTRRQPSISMWII